MDTVFDKWKKELTDFKESVSKDLAEIRKHKEEVRNMRDQMQNHLTHGRIISDSQRLILSAPEIIIGNVDKTGELISGRQSRIIIRGNTVNVEGVGETGQLNLKAPVIFQNAVNAGSDGEENVVENVSRIISQAKSINLSSKKEFGLFLNNFESREGGVTIHADGELHLDSSTQGDSKKKLIESHISTLETQKTEVKKKVDYYKSHFESLIKQMEDLLKQHNDLLPDDMDSRGNIGKVFELNDQTRDITAALSSAFAAYSRSISQLATTTWKISALKQQKEKVTSGENFTKNSNGSNISVLGEKIQIISKDGEGNYRDNDDSGVDVIANRINFSAMEADGSLKKKGNISLSAKDLKLSTLNSKSVSLDNNGKISAGELSADGSIVVQSKDISVESIDYKFSDNKLEEKELSKSGKISLRAETIDLSTVTPEGKAEGTVSVNSKNIDLKSMDIDKEKKTDKSLTTGSSMLLLSEKMLIGSKDKETESKLVQVSSEVVGTFAKATFEVQQGEKKGVLQMDGGKVEISGDKTTLYGETTVNAKTTFKAEIDAPKAVIDSIQAKSQFKSPNISDGMAAGGGGGGGTLSAKLTKEETPKEESKNKS